MKIKAQLLIVTTSPIKAQHQYLDFEKKILIYYLLNKKVQQELLTQPESSTTCYLFSLLGFKIFE